MNDPQSPGEQAYELSVGDVLQVGDLTVTVVDINEGEVSFRIDSPDHHEESDALLASSFAREAMALPPR